MRPHLPGRRRACAAAAAVRASPVLARILAPVPDLGEPTSYLTLEPGGDVYDASGERIGRIDHVLADSSVDVFDGLIVDISAGPGGLRFADAEQIDALYERGAVLNVAVAQLHEPSPSPGTVRATPDDVTDGNLEARLRRAWDYVSGRY
jgi:hypothetical protein